MKPNGELESQRLELSQATQWADQAQREKVNLCGELEMSNSIFQEKRVRDCQEIEELRRMCCSETGRARKLKIDDLSLQQKGNPSTVSQLFTQVQDLQNKENSLTGTRAIYDPETGSSSGVSQPLNIASPRGMLNRDSGLPLDTHSSLGTSGIVFVCQPAREGPSSAFFEKMNLASSSCGLG